MIGMQFTRRALTATRQGRQTISKAELVEAKEEINQNRIFVFIFLLTLIQLSSLIYRRDASFPY